MHIGIEVKSLNLNKIIKRYKRESDYRENKIKTYRLVFCRNKFFRKLDF